MTKNQIAVVKALALVVGMSVLGFLAKAANLEAFVSPATATIISALAVALEGVLSPAGTSLFGAVKHA